MPTAIKRRLWLETDRAYRAAAERLIRIKTNTQVKVAEEDDSDDFSSEEAAMHLRAAAASSISTTADWTERIRKLSARFQNYPERAHLAASASRRRPTRVPRQHRRHAPAARPRLRAHRDLGSRQSRRRHGPAARSRPSKPSMPPACPTTKLIAAAVDRVANDLDRAAESARGRALRRARPSSPARAAGVFFHEIFGHRVEGHRQKDESEGQTFTKSVGTKVLPDFLSVVFDPTRRKVGGIDLNGWYDYDDEGVKARPVTAVDNGVLKTFLMSRSPIKGFDHSNGHGRRQPGLEVVSRQSNLIVESTRSGSGGAAARRC